MNKGKIVKAIGMMILSAGMTILSQMIADSACSSLESELAGKIPGIVEPKKEETKEGE